MFNLWFYFLIYIFQLVLFRYGYKIVMPIESSINKHTYI